jgi:hypothetical protein
METSKKEQQIAKAHLWASRWLGDYNEAIESGKEGKAQRCLEKAQRWLDRLNELEGMGND